ncbi:hypothetical protein BHE74_00007026 [Ensete ventricosum]|nr:hypothetical protein BHE74_00007026 [Ensete ventricosum]
MVLVDFLCKEVQKLKEVGDPETVVAIERRASESQSLAENLQIELDEVSLEYCYQLALAQLRARHLGLEIEEDPFTLLPEDANMPMADEQPIDDSTLPVEE